MKYEHRNVKFHLTDKGHWVFDAKPSGRWAHWCRFFTPLEQYQTEKGSPLSMKQQAEIMRTAVDRMLSDSPIFTGDLRDQPIYKKANP